MAVDKPEKQGAGPVRTKRGRGRRMLGGLAAVVVLGLAGWYFWGSNGQETRTEPLIVTAEIGTIENTITAAGTLKPRNFVDVGAQVSGQLERLTVEVGDEVEEGELLAEIDARVQQSRVDSSRASLQALEAQVEARRSALQLARANAQRQERLREADATSQLDYDTAMNNLASAEANLIQLEKQIEQSLASLDQEETQLEFTSIFAPISGTVVSIEMNEGRTLNAAQQAPTILRIADLGTMTVETQISEADVSRIRKGMEVYFTTLGAGTRRWYGEVRQIQPTPVVENNVVLYTGLFDVGNDDGMLLPEMTAQVYFVTSKAENVLTVPLGALTFLDQSGPATAASAGNAAAMQRPAGNAANLEGNTGETRQTQNDINRAASNNTRGRQARVTLVNDDGSYSEQEVLIGLTSRVAAEVLAGLERGDRVVAGVLQGNAALGAGSGDRGGPPVRMMGGF